MAILVDKNSRILIQGITGPTGRSYAERMVANGTPLVGSVPVPSDKSIGHRALLFASLCDGESVSAVDEPRPSAPDQVAFFQLSGGSTGVPKLIPRTHDDYFYSVRRSAEVCRLTSESRYLCALPTAHNFPLSSPGALGVFQAGGTVVMAQNPSADLCFALIRRHKINFTSIVPTIASLWLDAADGALEAPTLNVIQVGGARLSEAVARRLVAVFGFLERSQHVSTHRFHVVG